MNEITRMPTIRRVDLLKTLNAYLHTCFKRNDKRHFNMDHSCLQHTKDERRMSTLDIYNKESPCIGEPTSV